MRQVITDDFLAQQTTSYSPEFPQLADSKAPNPPASANSRKSKQSSWTYAKKPSIAAATIIATATLCAIIFLLIWYLKRRRQRRARRLFDIENRNDDPFKRSSLSLTEGTSKTLDEFLLKDVHPERTSLMFSRSRSPSFTFVVDENDRRNTARLYHGSYDASSNNLSKLSSLTRVSTDGTRPSMVLSDLIPMISNVSGLSGSSCACASPSCACVYGSVSGSSSSTQVPALITASRLSRASTVAPTVRSSLWTTTTASTSSSSSADITQQLGCERDSVIARTALSPTLGPTRSLAGSPMRCSPSRVPRASSSRVSVSSPQYSGARAIELEDSLRVHAKYLERSTSTVDSFVDSTWSASGRASQLPSILSISSPQSPVFRFSENSG
ncbi:hypothetical protein N7520_000708 [Penicillium odoratum]|uniref:uncharacterized protein n=1 Tax=Penicillium odoratum TaxID=1167516 RepID=UPI0025482A8D|nr:uncharacterized protein N7520_000708 [Penicillium odoratum]KAJ5777462.1 hypothetical protein N7520_000708 [Penicillium odoratum]